MNIIQIVLLGLLAFLCFYVLVDRICKCVEMNAFAKAFGRMETTNTEDVLKKLKDETSHLYFINEQLESVKEESIHGKSREKTCGTKESN